MLWYKIYLFLCSLCLPRSHTQADTLTVISVVNTHPIMCSLFAHRLTIFKSVAPLMPWGGQRLLFHSLRWVTTTFLGQKDKRRRQGEMWRERMERESMETLSARRENPLTCNVMLSKLHKISVGSNGEAKVVYEAQSQFNIGKICHTIFNQDKK